MRTIHKYPLAITDEQVIESRVGAEPLTVQMQDGRVCLWALVDTAQPVTKHVVVIVGTGNPTQMATSNQYVGSVQERVFVWHVFTDMRASR